MLLAREDDFLLLITEITSKEERRRRRMDFLALAAITIVSIFFLFKFVITKGGRQHRHKLPGGSLGLPVIGETLSFLKAQKKDKGPEWFNKRILKHGPMFKTSLMGSPTVVIIGQSGNKFVLGADDDVFAAKQPMTISAIAGKHTIFELTGSRYRLLKGAIVSFLKPENLQNYIKQMDDVVKTLLLEETKEKDTTTKAVVLMKKLTFNLACTILFGIKDELTIQSFFADFILAFKGIWSLPVNFPGTSFSKGLRARSRIIKRVLPIMRKKKDELSKGILTPTSDVMSCMLALNDENEESITEEEILDNFITLVIASHDTSAILLSLMIWKLSREPEIYKKVLEEQMEIVRKRAKKEDNLTWGEIQKMKYTWRVAQELMRVVPPVFGSFRKALKDTSFGGYDIPKGWQVFWASYGTHMDKDIFANPEEFDPSRFENPSKSKPIPPFAYIPFGGGLHSCIGNEFARVETLTTIHNLITRYEWSHLVPDEGITRQPMPYPSMGLPIMLKPKKFE